MHKGLNGIICNFFTNEIQASFVCNEIKCLANHFETVNVYYLINCSPIDFPKNVKLHYLNHQQCNSKKIVQKYFPGIFRILFEEIAVFPKFLFNINSLRNELSRLIRSFYLYDLLLDEFNSKLSGEFFYTFWFNDWATVLAIAKSKNKINNYYSRVHGTDLFEERVPIIKHIAFRKFQLKHVTKVFSVSNKGSEYLKNKYPNFAQKISCLYLGTVYHGMNPLNHEKIITIVSCATIRNIKRIYLIPDILKEIKEQVLWIHIGGENKNDPTLPILKENLKHLPSNVKYEFKGALSNEEVFSFYKSIPVDAFLSVSETEGLPVSMMEAISFGIPIISTDVGGCNEIVNQETGILIPINFNPTEVAKKIIETKNKFGDIEIRKKIIEFWKTNFDAHKNFNKLIRKIETKH